MPKKTTCYVCKYCNVHYPTLQKARECEAQADEPQLKVGDFLLYHQRTGWRVDGNDDWWGEYRDNRKESGSHLNFGYDVIFVVTAIDRGDSYSQHRIRYHLFSNAYNTDKRNTGYGQGYTYNEHHVMPRKMPKKDVPKKVIEEAKEMIGLKSDKLL